MARTSGQQPVDLVRKARGGDREAFDGLMERYRRRLEVLVHLRMGPRLRAKFEVQDIVQEASLGAFESIARFEWRGEESFYRWLVTIAMNAIRDHARYLEAEMRAGNEVSLDVLDDAGGGNASLLAAEPVTPLRNLIRYERFQRLEKALDALSPEHREVIVLVRLERLPLREIAQKMHRTEGAVSMLVVRALQELRNVFKATDSLHLPALRLGAAREAAEGPESGR
jgi:RNA polymerase sigma-70 factor (ECF subfamily)